MVLPLFLLLGDIAAWWLTYNISTRGDTALTTIVGGVAVVVIIWLLIEVYELSEDAIPSRRNADSDY